jgi:hypothetical protein
MKPPRWLAVGALWLGMLAPGPVDLAGQERAEPSSSEPIAVAARSLLVPGWGQLARSQRRGWAYLAVEAVLWAIWAERRDAGADLRVAYRDLAWTEGRLSAGTRVDGDWTYYENLSKWKRSGAFDRDPQAPGLQPEEDPATFNGSIWALARDLYLGSGLPAPGEPSFDEALAYYRERAYPDPLLWDWTGREPALDAYKDLIRQSDDRFREATTAVGAVLANHLLSATDAYLSAAAGRRAGLRVVPPSRVRGWAFTLHLGFGG